MRLVEVVSFETVANLRPGEHVALATGEVDIVLEARYRGLQLRDTLLVLRPQRSEFIFMLRKPLSEASVLAQVMGTGTGGLNIIGCRSDKGRWPANLVLVHGPLCSPALCQSDCPIALLDSKSGFTESSGDPDRFAGTVKFKNKSYVKPGDKAAATIQNQSATAYGDQGGASRYFLCFDGTQAFYQWVDRL